MTLSLYTHPICLKHDMGSCHPESPQRLQAILQAVDENFTQKQITYVTPPKATREQLIRVHEPYYVDSIVNAAPKEGGWLQLDADTSMNEFTLDAALYASGAMVAAVDAVFNNKIKRAMCLVRPPGHHAEPDRAMGFCIFNNIAVGVAHALAQYQCQRVAIVDFDVHHGNGTEAMFIKEPKVLLWSSFQYPFYPGADLHNKPEHIHLCPLAAGTGSDEYRQKITNELIPCLNEFQPECMFISAGFDAHRLDPLAFVELKTSDYAFITEQVLAVANRYCQGRMISTLEGGYNLAALAESVVAHIKVML